MRTLLSVLLITLTTSAAGALAADPDTDPLLRQLNEQQRLEYQNQLNQASGDQERKEIQARYRELVREQARDASPGVDCGNRGAGKGGQPGDPCVAGKSGGMKKGNGSGVPAGDKNRPQKSGR